MQTGLPNHFDPWRLAVAGGHWQGVLTLERMPRLTSLLAAADGCVTVTLEAGIDAQNIAFLTGQLETTVALTCQRCLGPLALRMHAPFRLGLVRSEAQAAQLPEDYDPLLAPEGGLAMAEWVADELLLALPLVPVHSELRECQVHGFTAPGVAPAEQPSKPFAGLQALLQAFTKGN